MSKIYDCPCDTCSLRSKCGREATECKGVKQYYETGWFRTAQVKVNIKPMRFRKK